jgi:hypothetical protein
MPERSPHHEDAFGAPCIVRIDAHGSKDRAKDASADAHATISRACAGACALKRAYATTFPSSATFRHPLSSARRFRERIPAKDAGPTKAFSPTTPREERRLPDDQDAFDRHDT